MPDRRIVKASNHALPLLRDIIDSTSFLIKDSPAHGSIPGILEPSFGGDYSPESQEYFVGFEDHLPFGFVGFAPEEDCAEVFGPFLYRDFLHRGCGTCLLGYLIDLAKSRNIRVLYLLMPIRDERAIAFFSRNGFEVVSDSPEFIKRWRDGLLAARPIADGAILLAQVLGIDD